METSEETKNMPLGRKISRIRELRGMKQDALASELGVTHQMISKVEQSDDVSDLMLEKIAEVLGVTPDAIKNYSDEAAIYNIQNNYDGSSNSHGSNNVIHHNCTFNPLDELVKAYYANQELYERLLAAEREKNELLKGR